ncbi:MAG TPA: 1-deoxy-D-xylulose-5-phosphate reductoisomerase [Rhodospirillales bacterium]|nr:1-deoxy-D-xylulose-5-phosphate reductoisomerase [Rhodospirillales bacterium]
MAVTEAQQKTDLARRRVTILGSTGSVGCNTVDLIERSPAGYVIEALTANRNVEELTRQALKLKPRIAVVADPSCYNDLKQALSGSGIDVAAGAEAVADAASRPAEWVMASIVGTAGLVPTLKAVERGAIVGLANKECLVSAGDLMMAEFKRCGATLIPVDSEHSAIFQIYDFDDPGKVRRIVLTASGGPFRQMSRQDMASVTPQQAVAHPNWDMGAKISIDSATMMNKGLELIEAYHLFDVDEQQIEILVHPQSVVHSMVDYVDGSVLAQLGSPDMRTPISYALGWPRRLPTPAARLNLAEIGSLTFEPPDPIRFPALGLARQCLQTGGSAPTVLNAANEIAVEGFLACRIGFLDIVRIVERSLEKVPAAPVDTLEDVLAVDLEARKIARDFLE